MGNIQCGGKLTEDCLGDTDIRYDAESSNNLKDQSVVWQKMEGLWVGDIYQYGDDYEPQRFSDLGPFNTFPWPHFVNITVVETRYYEHSMAVFGSDIPNVTGLLFYSDTIGHSTFEKDGSMQMLPVGFGLNNVEELTSAPAVGSVPTAVTYPVGDNAFMSTQFSKSQEGDITFWFATRTCMNDDCTKSSASYEGFENGVRTEAWTGVQDKVSVEEWTQRAEQAYLDADVPPQIQSPIPMEDECLAVGKCRTNEDFCSSGDPSCSTSPYQEPDGKVKPGVIAALTIGGFILLVAIMSFGFWRYTVNRDKRNRVKFATRVAQNMSIRKSARSLTPGMLEKEFNKIDKDHGGRITKKALWEFLNSGKAGEINERDFEALWAVMDADNSGSVDFLEFCAYMAHCYDEYNEAARANRGSIAVASSIARVSVARSISIKVSERGSEGLKGIVAEEEEQKENDEEG